MNRYNYCVPESTPHVGKRQIREFSLILKRERDVLPMNVHRS